MHGEILRNYPALTFEQLSWPTGAQLSGADSGVYHASAQLFVNDLLDLKDGAVRLRAMLQKLAAILQLADGVSIVRSAKTFRNPSTWKNGGRCKSSSFAAPDPGPQWTPAVSREKLDEILSVPVELRAASNALPAHAEISLQAVIRNFDSARQTAILQTKLRDLELAQLRMAQQLAALTDGYRRALAAYLGENNRAAPAPPFGKQRVGALKGRARMKR